MSEHRIRITETSSRIVTIDAGSEHDAIEAVQQQYADEKIVLGEADYDDVNFEVV